MPGTQMHAINLQPILDLGNGKWCYRSAVYLLPLVGNWVLPVCIVSAACVSKRVFSIYSLFATLYQQMEGYKCSLAAALY